MIGRHRDNAAAKTTWYWLLALFVQEHALKKMTVECCSGGVICIGGGVATGRPSAWTDRSANKQSTVKNSLVSTYDESRSLSIFAVAIATVWVEAVGNGFMGSVVRQLGSTLLPENNKPRYRYHLGRIRR